jgi:hypothetical protein
MMYTMGLPYPAWAKPWHKQVDKYPTYLVLVEVLVKGRLQDSTNPTKHTKLCVT